MKTPPNPSETWEPCATGLLTGVAARGKSVRRRRAVVKVGIGAALLSAVVGVAAWTGGWGRGPRENYFGGIACREVGANLGAYASGSLAPELKSKIDVHLLNCPMCQERLREMQAVPAAPTQASATPACDCPECRRLQQLAMRSHGKASNDALALSMSRPGASAR